MKEKLSAFLHKDGTRTVLSSLISILFGMAVGSLIIVIVAASSQSLTAKSAWEGVQMVFGGLFSTGRDAVGELTFGFNPTNIGNMLFRAVPIIMTGLSVAVAFKTGLFNIGASGQYLMGTAVSLILALSIPSTTLAPWLIWLIAFLGGMLAGALWGAVSGALKAFLNINEVLACIMTNWIAANVVTLLFENSPLRNSVEYGKMGYIYMTSYNNVETAKIGLDKLFPGSQVNGGILVAILLSVVIHVILAKTTFGYELKACGSNRFAAKYAGVKDKRNIILSMAIAGSLSGAAAALYYLSGNTEFFWNTYQALPAAGFNGIPVALLAANNPIGVIFSGCFLSMLNVAGLQLKNLTAFNEHITNVIIAVIVYLSAFSLVIKMALTARKKKRKGNASQSTLADAAAAPPAPVVAAEETAGGDTETEGGVRS